MLISNGRVGISTWTSAGGKVETPVDDVIDLDHDIAEWPPCPVCCQQRLRRDPDSTDLLFTEDLPDRADRTVTTGRRRTDRA